MTEQLARFLYERQARSYEADQETMDQMWAEDPGLRGFWIDEAAAVLAYLRLEHATVLPTGS